MTKYRGIETIQMLIGIALVFIIGIAVLPTVANTVTQVTGTNATLGQTGANVTGAANSLAQLITLLFAAILLVFVLRFLGL